MRFRVFQRLGIRGRQWHFQGRADGNNRIIMQSEGYNNLNDCLRTVDLIRAEAAGATLHIEEKRR